MNTIRYWFLGFRAGWRERRSLPIAAAWGGRDSRDAAYYNGYALGADIALRIAR